MAIPEYDTPDYMDRVNRPGFAAPPPGSHPANATWGYHYTVPAVQEAWEETDDYRWPNTDNSYTAGSPSPRDDLTVPRRYGVEEMVSDPEHFPIPQREARHKPVGPDPKWTPAPEHVGVSTPSQWRFWRPFGQDVEHRFNGDRFSMASHTRTYPIHGMEPWADRRNTYRTEPPPRDVTIQDRSPDVEPDTPNAVYTTPIPADQHVFSVGATQSWRL